MAVTPFRVASRSLHDLPKRDYSRSSHVMDVPDLIRLQIDSYLWFKDEGLQELFEEVSPIADFTGRMELRLSKEIDPGIDKIDEIVHEKPLEDVTDDEHGNVIAPRLQPITEEMAQAIKRGHKARIPVLVYRFAQPKYTEAECRDRDATFAAPLWVTVQLRIKEAPDRKEEIKEQELFFGDFPLMTANGTFIINGAERVVVSQLVRSPGIYYTLEIDPTTGRELCYGKLIPNRGAWLEFETSNKDILSVKVDRKKKVHITTLLRAMGLRSDDDILARFADVDTNADHAYVRATLDRDATKTQEEALLDFYRKLRPGEPPNLENARSLISGLFSNPRRYDLGRVGRYKLSSRLGLQGQRPRILTLEDLVDIVRQMVLLNNGIGSPDDIDHLGNRRVRAVGELIQNQFRIGLLRLERAIRERMTVTDPELAVPSNLMNIRPVVAAIREFFGGSQLSQFMDQTNPLSELTNKRRLSALGPGCLSRERAGFEVRDVHHSHYGRICPIETPEGPNIGLIGALAVYGSINPYGFIETPYRRVLRTLPSNDERLLDQVLATEVRSNGHFLATAGTQVTSALLTELSAIPEQTIPIVPVVSSEVVFLSADQEEQFSIAQASTPLDDRSHFVQSAVEVRHGSRFLMEPPDRVDLVDISPKQIASVATSLIPFLEHDDPLRALMGANMQRQAVPLVRPEAPLVGTGMEWQVAADSGQVVIARASGLVTSVTGTSIVVRSDDGEEERYDLQKFHRSNQGTCLNQRPIVLPGDRVVAGQPLADSSSTAMGELALGQNVLAVFMSWEGYNFEDAIVLSENVVRKDMFTSIHIEKHETEARDTKLGPEEITRDIPNVGEESLRDLDEEGIIRIGAEVGPGDILVGKITPKGETELTAEEKLLRAIFGEKARDVKDTSLRVPHGERGKVIDVRVFTRATNPDLPAGVNKLVRVSMAQKRKVSEGDKMAGRHGNKGVISRILPIQDMPYLADGTPVEIILNPIGVPSRMNLGQIFEAHLGWAAKNLGFRAVSPIFDGASDVAIEDALCRTWLAQRAGALDSDPSTEDPLDPVRLAEWLRGQGEDATAVMDESLTGMAKEVALRIWLREEAGHDSAGMGREELADTADALVRERGLVPPTFGKMTLYDGRTGQPFDQPITVGYMYMMKLVHLVEDKIHARSTGPYSLITQQPLGGKAQFGGQRFGEMEVWALEAYGAAHILQEILTVKSDDVVGRVKTYEAIVKGEDIQEPGVPESFKVLVQELQSLGLAVEVLNEEEERVTLTEESGIDIPELGINLTGFEGG